MKLSRNKKIVLLGLGFIIMTLSFIAIKNRSFLRDLLTIRMSNTLERVNSEPVLAVFSFNSQEENKLLKSCYHYRLKLSQSKGIDFNQTEIDEWTYRYNSIDYYSRDMGA